MTLLRQLLFRPACFLLRRGGHYGLIVCGTGFALLALGGLTSWGLAGDVAVFLTTLLIAMLGAIADGLHSPHRCDRCVDLLPDDTARMIAAPEERWTKVMRIEHRVTPVAVAVILTLMALSSLAIVSHWRVVNIVALTTLAVLFIGTALVRSRHIRRRKWCAQCRAKLLLHRKVLLIRLADLEHEAPTSQEDNQ